MGDAIQKYTRNQDRSFLGGVKLSIQGRGGCFRWSTDNTVNHSLWYKVVRFPKCLASLQKLVAWPDDSRSESGQRKQLFAVKIKASWVCRAGGRFQYCDTTSILSLWLGRPWGALAPTHNSSYAVCAPTWKLCRRTEKQICVNIGVGC